ncbi:MAG: hypothetical protein ACI956_002746, partial [Nonlabens sp.]
HWRQSGCLKLREGHKNGEASYKIEKGSTVNSGAFFYFYKVQKP